MRLSFLFGGLLLIFVCLTSINACKWAYLAQQGMANPHAHEGSYSEDDLGKFENLQAFEDFYSGHEHEHEHEYVPYNPNDHLVPPNPDL